MPSRLRNVGVKLNRSKWTFKLLGLRYGFNLPEMMKFVFENQYWSQDQIEAYQLNQLRLIIAHAFNKVPYYRHLMDSIGMEPGDFKQIADLQNFPILRKSDIIPNYKSFLASDFQNYKPMERSTGGTTGVPFKYNNDIYSWGLNWATKMRAFTWGGYRFGIDLIARLQGGSMIGKGNFNLKTNFWRFLQNNYTVPIMNMTDASMDYHVKQIINQKISFLKGYPSSIYTLARYLENRKMHINMKCVFTTAEMLHQYQRTLIEEVFNQKVLDVYGCGDGMAGASQCEVRNGYHSNVETCYMEIINNHQSIAQNGEEGEIIVTSLHDYAMPLIRYSPGDMAVNGSSKCDCGRNLPVLDKIIGRTSDLLDLPNGRVINGLSIPFEMWTEKIEKFQLVQEEEDLLVLNIIPKGSFDATDEKKIIALLSFNAGEGIRIQINKVEQIEQTSAGKFKYVITKVKTREKI